MQPPPAIKASAQPWQRGSQPGQKRRDRFADRLALRGGGGAADRHGRPNILSCPGRPGASRGWGCRSAARRKARSDSAAALFESTFRGESIRGVWLHQRLEDGFLRPWRKRSASASRHYAWLWGFAVALLLVLGAIGLASRWAIRKGLSPGANFRANSFKAFRTTFRRSIRRGFRSRSGNSLPRWNALFAGLERAGNQQRQFLQDAAHQLRTPLANLQLHLNCSAARRKIPRSRQPCRDRCSV